MLLFPKGKKPTKKELTELMPDIKYSDFKYLASASVGKAIIYQLRFEELVLKDEEWIVNISEGTMEIGGNFFPVQLLGIEHIDASLWLWAWGSEQELPSELFKNALLLKDFGISNSFTELTDKSLNLDESINGFFYSYTGLALSPENLCYCRCPYENGSIYVLIKNLPDNLFTVPTGDEILKGIREAIGRYKLNHQALVKSIMLNHGRRFKFKNSKMTCITPDKKKLTVIFNDNDNIHSANIL